MALGMVCCQGCREKKNLNLSLPLPGGPGHRNILAQCGIIFATGMGSVEKVSGENKSKSVPTKFCYLLSRHLKTDGRGHYVPGAMSGQGIQASASSGSLQGPLLGCALLLPWEDRDVSQGSPGCGPDWAVQDPLRSHCPDE